MMDDWQSKYKPQVIEPLEYLPCPGSVSCAKATSRSDDDEEVDDDLYPAEMCE
jgi:hypothetical protein